jgi:hypothetical protein
VRVRVCVYVSYADSAYTHIHHLHTHTHAHTHMHMHMNTCNYRRAGERGVKADVYSLAMLALYLGTAYSPWFGETGAMSV